MTTTTAPAFIHLRLHSEYSVTDGIVRLSDGIAHCVRDAMPALALTDMTNLFGVVKFYIAAREKGLKPLCGADIWLHNENAPESPFRLLLLVKNHQGYRQLCALLSRAYQDDKRHDRAEIRREWLKKESCDGLIALSGGQAGDVGDALLQGNRDVAKKRAQAWESLFPDAFYLEVQRYGQPQQENSVQALADLAADLGLPLVATHPIQFMAKEDFQAHEVRVCIAEGYTLADTRRPHLFTEEQYFKTTAEMQSLFADLPEALLNSVEIAKRCNLELTLDKNFLPDFPTPHGMSLSDFLAAEAKKGLENRLQQLFPDAENRDRKRPEYDERLRFECETIVHMGFPGYFLIVADFINWGKNNGVPVGPGRGSGAGSLVAYALGITDLDPLAYALLFERFLNPERVTMPDFDVDFCQDNRGRVIEYVRDRYGSDAVSQIVTFGTLSSKAVIRDVGRVLDLPYSLCDRLSKLIPIVQNKPLSLAKALEQEPQFAEMMKDERDGESVQILFNLAASLEDLTRNVGMHAGGVLIAPGKITDFCPIYKAIGADAVPVSQFDKDDVEKAGLVKFDFLGLRNLTIIEQALSDIAKMTGTRPDLMAQGFSDPATYKILREANTTAVFQVESEGMKKLLKKLEPDRFEDIIAVLALYRPGPLGSGMVDDFIDRKKGRQNIEYFHPDLKDCLDPTYGVIVYQEQVMQISQIIGGYTLGGADMLRRAMGKKKAEDMAMHRESIAAGAETKGYDPRLAERLFDLMTKFAEYGFNKSHTAAYAVITYQTAWLKAHHAAAFMAATLSSDMDNTDTVKFFYDDAIKNGLSIKAPDINSSDYRFLPLDRRTIRYGLGAIKGTGQSAVDAIMAARQVGGAFKDLFDFCCRCDKRHVNRRTIESLIRAGAFDALNTHRHQLLASVGLAIEFAEQSERNAMQSSLFDMGEAMHHPAYPDVSPWDDRSRLREEKVAIGFFLSGHPYESYLPETSRFVRYRLNQLQAGREKFIFAGIVTGTRSTMTRRGKMLFILLDDGTATLEIPVFNEIFEAAKHKIVTDELLFVEGNVSLDKFSDTLVVRADNLFTLGEVRSRFARHLQLDIGTDKADAQRLKGLLQPFVPGTAAVHLRYQNAEAECEISLGDAWRVRLDDALIEALKTWLGKSAVHLVY